jgi:hypothetical protein
MSAQNSHQFDFESFQGFSLPHYTQVPDLLFDQIMQDLDEKELKVLLYIIRRTFGFKKQDDNISLNQLADGIKTKDGRVLDRGTGLSRTLVKRALRSLKEKNLIVARRNVDTERGNLPTTYSLKMQSDPRGNSDPTPRVSGDPRVGSPETPTINSNTTNSTTTEVDLENNNSSGEPDTKSDVVVALLNKGISKNVAHRLTHRYSRQRIIKQIDHLEYLLETDPKKVTNPRGWLRRAIEDDYDPPDGFKSRAEREADAAAAEKRRQALKEHEAQQQAAEEKKRQKAHKAREEKLTAMKKQYNTTPETEALWSSWLNHIRATDPTGAALLQSGCELLAIHDHEVVLWVDNTLFLKTVQRNYAKTIKQLAARHLKISFTEVELKPVIAAKNSEEDDP